MNIQFINDENNSDILERYSTFIFDCDGVLWESGKVFPSAILLINKLQ